MKKRSLSVIALAAAMSLSACGGNGTDAQKAEEITAGMVSAETTLPEETESSALSSEEPSADTETSSPSEPVYCPYVIGYTEDEAMTELEPIGLNVTISSVPDCRFIPGTVIDQSIMDIEVSSGDEITLTVTEWGDTVSLISQNSVTGYGNFPTLFTYEYDDLGRLVRTTADSYDCWETFYLSDAADGKYRLARTCGTRYSYDETGMTVTASRTDTEISADGTENSLEYKAVIYFDGEKLGSDLSSICTNEDMLYGDIYWGYKDNGYYESCTYSYDDNGNIISITGEEDSSGSIYPCEEFVYTQIDSDVLAPETFLLDKLLIESGPSVSFIDWQPAD